MDEDDDALVERMTAAARRGDEAEAEVAAAVLAYRLHWLIRKTVRATLYDDGYLPLVDDAIERVAADVERALVTEAGRRDVRHLRAFVARVAQLRTMDWTVLTRVRARVDGVELLDERGDRDDGYTAQYARPDAGYGHVEDRDALDPVLELVAHELAALDARNPVQAQVVTGFFYEDVPAKVLAERHGLTEANVNKICSRFRKRCATAKDEMEDPT